MPITCQIDSLLSAATSDEMIREILLDLTPERVDLQTFSSCVQKVASCALPEFNRLSQYSNSVIDCCGTGGSGIEHFNTSTASAFVLAASGIKVAKIGNRSASGPSGSFDILGQLGFKANLTAKHAEQLINDCNLVFLYAPQVYPVLIRLGAIRKSLKTKTIFNFIGPLLNPVNPDHRLIGVSNASMQQTLASYLAASKKNAMLVRGHCGLDEFCPGCQTHLLETSATATANFIASSTHEGLNKACPANSAVTSTTADNARMLLDIFNKQDTDSTPYNLVCLNAGAAMFVKGTVKSIDEGRLQAAELIASGAVAEQFRRTRSAYDKYAF